ncbi:hypothetical protein HYY74_01475 [Candidatus Woesearchaeota archaeon]|nr:hypothetical protein [Candidatus Woesearchaeota archaeon]
MTLQDDMIQLVLIRIESMPDYIEVNLGSFGTLNKAALISHIKKNDELGKQIVAMQMEYLRSLKSL